MTGRGSRTARGRAAGCALALLLLSACTVPGAPGDGSADRGIRRTLDRRAAAVLGHDESGYLSVVDPRAKGLRTAQRAEFRNLAAVPLSSWEYRVGDVERQGSTATARVELRYRITGYDSAPVAAGRTLKLVERDGRWYIDDDSPDGGTGQQLWQQGPVRTARGKHSLVLGVGGSGSLLRQVAAVADRAVPAVDAAWHRKWAGRVVVLVPASLDSMGALLGSPAATYRGIAAVTTGEAGGAGAAPADRVIVNPEAYALLGSLGRQVVITHETTHVATRTATSTATPLWLSEGFADWVAYRDTGSTPRETAPELQRAVRGGRLPAALPTDADFGFSDGADRLARAYEGGWLACRMIAGQWGEQKLTDFYRAVGADGQRDGAVEKAMNDVLGTDPAAFTARWRDYLRAQLD
ncbi:hypothetical protein [Streptomyces sp. NBC_00859]|uniref:hypothetical protein n=1 Tax=Streptomyces sp. NBC_00859 TaxID=2903682 RepID=UPI0038630A87|nr:hypothetical protein OG584_26340 [Streptomyces sp. NBC_00859]